MSDISSSLYAYLNRDKQMNEFLSLSPAAKRRAILKHQGSLMLYYVSEIMEAHNLSRPEACRLFVTRSYPDIIQLEQELGTKPLTAKTLSDKLWHIELALADEMPR